MCKKLLALLLAVVMCASMLIGCQSSQGNGEATANTDSSQAPAETSGSAAATAPTKVRVEMFDRNSAPEGAGTAIDNKWTTFIKEHALAEANLDVEFVACPRAEEVTKLNVWMASSSAPDISYTYDFNVLYGYADQGGIYDLTEYINSPDSKIKQYFETSLPWGIYKGKQYAIPAVQADFGGNTAIYVRQDWLDKLGSADPTTPDELYAMLKAFKTQDPGGVGKANVVPFAMPAPGVTGTQGFYLDIMLMFGVEYDGPYIPCMPTGNYENGVFMSPVDNPYAKNGYAFLNKLYKEGLIHPEFVTDVNGAKYDQHVFSGMAGMVNVNPQTPGAAKTLNVETQKAVSDAYWKPIKPLANPNGEIIMQGPRKGGLLMFIPKSSEKPEAALKYLEWMRESGMDKILKIGQEGVHYNMVDGAIVYPDQAAYAKDIGWVGGDLGITSGDLWTTTDMLKKKYPGRDGEDYYQLMEWSKQYGRTYEVITEPRPNTLKNASTLQDYMFEGAAKVIVAKDFEKEYENYVNGWKKLGGDAYDAEIASALKTMGK